jgi:hypothetical protein
MAVLGLTLGLSYITASADIVVVVSPRSSVTTLSKVQIVDI